MGKMYKVQKSRPHRRILHMVTTGPTTQARRNTAFDQQIHAGVLEIMRPAEFIWEQAILDGMYGVMVLRARVEHRSGCFDPHAPYEVEIPDEALLRVLQQPTTMVTVFMALCDVLELKPADIIIKGFLQQEAAVAS